MLFPPFISVASLGFSIFDNTTVDEGLGIGSSHRPTLISSLIKISVQASKHGHWIPTFDLEVNILQSSIQDLN